MVVRKNTLFLKPILGSEMGKSMVPLRRGGTVGAYLLDNNNIYVIKQHDNTIEVRGKYTTAEGMNCVSPTKRIKPHATIAKTGRLPLAI